jgi:hypothetical protein
MRYGYRQPDLATRTAPHLTVRLTVRVHEG